LAVSFEVVLGPGPSTGNFLLEGSVAGALPDEILCLGKNPEISDLCSVPRGRKNGKIYLDRVRESAAIESASAFFPWFHFKQRLG
jgi:hypothetical protein